MLNALLLLVPAISVLYSVGIVVRQLRYESPHFVEVPASGSPSTMREGWASEDSEDAAIRNHWAYPSLVNAMAELAKARVGGDPRRIRQAEQQAKRAARLVKLWVFYNAPKA
jgi:hypothetical protein